MPFNSIDFVIFFPLVVATFFLSPRRFQWVFLLVASYFFYGYWNVYYLVLIWFTTLTSFGFALVMGRTSEPSRRKMLLTACIAINLSILLVFKYYDFFASSASHLILRFGGTIEFGSLGLLLPLGISFYTFQSVGYLVDVYRGHKEVERHLGIYALYVVFFPQLVAGPIERSMSLMPQFHQPKSFSIERLVSGLRLVIWGYFLKLVIADRVAGYVSAVYITPEDFTGGHFILSTFLFGYQIFGDFAGYSCIAIGTARILGFDLMLNFRRPYWSRSVGEFWSRWHISLSTWFRDYVYIPLGGNRVSKPRHFVNLLIVFLLSGLWHGANWTFVVWGAIHGALLITEIQIATVWKRSFTRQPGGAAAFLISLARRSYVILAVCFAWIFFRANTLDDALHIVTHLFSGIGFGLNDLGRLIIPFTGDNAAVAAFLSIFGFIVLLELIHYVQENDVRWVLDRWERSAILQGTGLGLLVLTILMFGRFSSGQFIYFHF